MDGDHELETLARIVLFELMAATAFCLSLVLFIVGFSGILSAGTCQLCLLYTSSETRRLDPCLHLRVCVCVSSCTCLSHAPLSCLACRCSWGRLRALPIHTQQLDSVASAKWLAQFDVQWSAKEQHYMGGDCLNTGCVPSKALFRVKL